MADFYSTACERLDAAGVRQYEISNFARGPAGNRDTTSSTGRASLTSGLAWMRTR